MYNPTDSFYPILSPSCIAEDSRPERGFMSSLKATFLSQLSLMLSVVNIMHTCVEITFPSDFCNLNKKIKERNFIRHFLYLLAKLDNFFYNTLSLLNLNASERYLLAFLKNGILFFVVLLVYWWNTYWICKFCSCFFHFYVDLILLWYF